MTARTRTPSDLKWVANELAAVAGEIEQVQEQLAQLPARLVHLEQMRQSLEEVGGALGAPALSDVMAAVRVHRAYGGCGFLIDWLQAVLRAVAPGSLDTVSLSRLAAEQFGLPLPSQKEHQRFRHNSMARALRKLAARGLVERRHSIVVAGGTSSVWRWKPELGFDDLRAAAEAQERA